MTGDRELSIGPRAARPATGDAGIALPVVIVALGLLAFMMVGAFSVSRTEFKASHNVKESSVAVFAAQAGAEFLIANWDSLGVDSLLATPGDSLDLGWQTLANRARYRAMVRRTDAGNSPKYSIMVEGRSRAAGASPRWVAVNLETDGPALFSWVVFGKDLVKLGNDGVTGDVGSNGDLDIGTTLDGDATVGGTVSDSSAVSGTVTEGAAHLPVDTIPCPTGPYGPPPPIGAPSEWDSVTGAIKMGTNGDVTYTGGTYYYSTFEKNGNDYVHLVPGDTVVIYVSDLFKKGGNGFTNPFPNTAGNLQIYGCGSSTTEWSFGGNGEVWMSVYAPTHKFKVGGNGDLHGSFIAREFEAGGNNQVLYDSTVQRIDGPAGGGGTHVVSGSWTAIGR
jgi:hypothetical protein